QREKPKFRGREFYHGTRCCSSNAPVANFGDFRIRETRVLILNKHNQLVEQNVRGVSTPGQKRFYRRERRETLRIRGHPIAGAQRAIIQQAITPALHRPITRVFLFYLLSSLRAVGSTQPEAIFYLLLACRAVALAKAGQGKAVPDL